VPDSRCPISTDRLENYRRAIVYRQNGNNEASANHNRKEPWFRVKRGTTLPGNIPP